jgi:hypothetical protein
LHRSPRASVASLERVRVAEAEAARLKAEQETLFAATARRAQCKSAVVRADGLRDVKWLDDCCCSQRCT